MAEESKLKIECAKLQSNIKLLEDGLSQLRTSLQRHQSGSVDGRQRLIALEQRKFEERKLADKEKICKACGDMSKRVSDFLDTFPELSNKEFSGKYEVKDLESQLSLFYPQSLLSNYTCPNPISFEDEGEAYAAYAYVERNIFRLKEGSILSSVFTGISSLLEKATSTGLGSKALLIFVALFMLTFAFAPMAFLAVFTVIGITSMAYGKYVNSLLRNLYSVKLFLNNTYDEDIFQDDKFDIMEGVEEFLDEVEQDYCQDVDSREFVMPPKMLEDYDNQMTIQQQKLEAQIQQKTLQLDEAKTKLSELIKELEEAIRQREEAASEARAKILDTVTWRQEWLSSILLDVTKDNRVIGCRWTQGNSLYFSKQLEYLQQFQLLAVYQGILHMHPNFCGQVVLDYKYMGGRLVPFGRLLPIICELDYNDDDIEKRIGRIRNDIRARTENILQSCASLDEFNKLMGTYGVTGESYVVVHICGISSISNELKMMVKNGPRVGYFFKLYFTMEELGDVLDNLPFEDITEYGEVNEVLVPRTAGQVQRMLVQQSSNS